MSTFEYYHFRTDRRLGILPGLNALGKEGWEVVCREPEDIASYAYLLKRETSDDVGVTIRSDITLPPEHLKVVAANVDGPLPDADAAAAERTVKRLVPRDPPDTRIPWAERSLRPCAMVLHERGKAPSKVCGDIAAVREDKVPATAS